MIGIYAIRNMQNGKVYIGKSEDILTRWSKHISTLNNHQHYCQQLQSDWDNQDINDFRFVILEQYVIPNNVFVNNLNLQMLLFCREYVNMKRYDAIHSGYNSELTLKEVLEPSNDQSRQKYIRYQNNYAAQFYKDNKQLLLSQVLTLDDFISLVVETDQEIDPTNKYYTFYGDQDCFDIKIKEYQDKLKKKNQEITDLKKQWHTLQNKSKLYKKNEVLKQLGTQFHYKYNSYVVYFADVKAGYLRRMFDVSKQHCKFEATKKGIDSGYYVEGKRSTNGFTNGDAVLTEKGVARYKDIANHINQYISEDELYYENGLLYPDWDKITDANLNQIIK